MTTDQQILLDALRNRIKDPKEARSLAVLRTHHSIGNAANLLNCSAEDLLHLGGIGQVEILAPIKAYGTYQWPPKEAFGGFPECTKLPMEFELNEPTLVTLTEDDLKRIERLGQVVPRFFFSPELAMEIAPPLREDLMQLGAREPEDDDVELPDSEEFYQRIGKTKEEIEKMLELPEHFRTTQTVGALRQIGYLGPWEAADIDERSAQPTSIKDLFIWTDEILNIIGGADDRGVALVHRQHKKINGSVHGVALSNRLKQLEIVRAAYYILRSRIAGCKKCNVTHRGLSGLVEQEAFNFWAPDAHRWTIDRIERLLGEFNNYPTPKFRSAEARAPNVE